MSDSISTVAGLLDTIGEQARKYRCARNWVDTFIGDEARAAHAEANPGWPMLRQPRRHGHGHSAAHRLLPPAEPRRTRPPHQGLRPTGSDNPLSLSQADAGIYRDPTKNRLFILQAAADEALPRQ
ncbi:hypothetical protein O7631_17660 [Micromonospora sp. WMMD967]|uniref:hypothetical protein n=1 Tax=Micromonospora sp. WMMD967 TaxID=3016101 RepID=UPI0024176566|nr:hypothetical protein [Micromonospora sp. WMMD967]MDG4838349.1 hypothetical protein [Micromonospora sp. WMMD967]